MGVLMFALGRMFTMPFFWAVLILILACRLPFGRMFGRGKKGKR